VLEGTPYLPCRRLAFPELEQLLGRGRVPEGKGSIRSPGDHVAVDDGAHLEEISGDKEIRGWLGGLTSMRHMMEAALPRTAWSHFASFHVSGQAGRG
jgi:hypothetical protein